MLAQKLVLTFIVMMTTSLAAAQSTYRATLAGSREVPSLGDGDASGLAVATIDGSTLYFFLYVHNMAAPTAAHIHTGAAGTGGGVLVGLVSDGGGFASVGAGSYIATGSLTLTEQQRAAISGNPAGHYFNVHNGEYPAGAVRGQLFGDGAADRMFATDLLGGREVPNPGDGDGRGFAALAIDAGSLYYYLWTKAIAPPTAAHVHAGLPGSSGGFIVTLVGSSDGFTDVGGGVFVAAGSTSIGSGSAQIFLADPGAFYVNVHNADFPGGAIRGQVAPPETHVVLPIVSRAQGQAGSNWVTDLRLLNPYDLDAEVLAEWYPTNTSGLTGPVAVAELNVVAGGQGVYNNIVSSLFSANGNGAVRLISWRPVAAAARIYNDQRSDPEIGGTFGQFASGLAPQEALATGAIPLLANRPVGDATGFRSNVGFFNPWRFPVQTSLTVRLPDGSVLGTTNLTLQPYANQIAGIFSLVPGVPGGLQTQTDIFLTFVAARPVFMYGSVVDNKTNDAILPLPARFPFIALADVNNPPSGSITEPAAAAVNTAVGEELTFAASTYDPDGDDVSVEWDFDDGVKATGLVTTHSFASAGTYSVSLVTTDEHGASDPTPATVTVTVAAAATVTLSQLQAEVFTPRCAGCHPPNGGGLDLRAGQTWASTVNVNSFGQPALKRIAPGDPDNSYLYRKVVGGPSISGSRMPQGGPFLTQAEVDKLRQWIVDGAQDN